MKTKALLILAILLVSAPAHAVSGVGTGGAAKQSRNPLDDLKVGESPFEVCKDVAMVSSSAYKQNKEYWDSAIAECGSDVNVQIMPDSGFLQAVVSSLKNSDATLSSFDFLKRLGERTATYVQANNELSERLQNCGKGDKAWFAAKQAAATSEADKKFYDFDDCQGLLSKTRDLVETEGKAARIQRAILEATGNGLDVAKSWLNEQNDAKLPIEMMPIGADEMAEAQKQIAKDNAEAEAEYTTWLKESEEKFQALVKQNGGDVFKAMNSNELDPQYRRFRVQNRQKDGTVNMQGKAAEAYRRDIVAKAKAKIFTRHKEEFLGKLAGVPVLGYLSKAKPTDAEIGEGAAAVLKNGQKELADIKAKLAKANSKTWRNGRATNAVSDEQRTEVMLDFMKYGPVVKELLANDKGDCRTATGLANMISSSDSRQSAVVMAGMIGVVGASALIPGAAGLGAAAMAGSATVVGIGASTMMYKMDSAVLDRAKQRAFSAVETKAQGKSISDMKEFDEARDTLALDLAMSPADLIGSGIGVAGLKVAGAAAGLGMRVLKNPLQKAALKKALASKGLRDVEIERLFKDLQSVDADVARAAARRIMTAAELDETQLKFLRTAASKGLIKEQNPESVAAVMKEVKDQQVFDRAFKIMDQMNTAKINAGNRDQSLKAVMAGAPLVDEKGAARLAAAVGDWDEGVEGLTAAYQRTNKKIETPEFKKIANVEERKKAAFLESLDEMRVEQLRRDEGLSLPEAKMRTLNDKDWVSQKNKMCGCSGVCSI